MNTINKLRLCLLTIIIMVAANVVAQDNSFLLVSPKTIVFDAEGGSNSVTVVSNVQWKVESDVSWLYISNSSGTGNGIFTLTVGENSSSEIRTATVAVSGRGTETVQVEVTQMPGEQPYVIVSPTSIAFGPAGGMMSVAVSSNSVWRAESAASWLYIHQSSGAGNGSFDISTEAHPTGVARTATVTVSGDGTMSAYVEVTQLPGDEHFIVVSPTNVAFEPAGGSRTVEVISNTNWWATSDQGWLEVVNGTGYYEGRFHMEAFPNNTGTSRTATVTVSGEGTYPISIEVMQMPGEQPYLIVSTTKIAFDGNGGIKPVDVASNVPWRAESDAAWLTVSGGSDTGNGWFTLRAEANSDSESRTARITVLGEGAEPTYIEVMQLPKGFEQIKGDVNDDGTVDVADIATIISIMASSTARIQK